MKKGIIAALAATVLLVSTSAAMAANPQGKVSLFYTPGTVEVDGSDDVDFDSFGVRGELSFANKFGVDGSYATYSYDNDAKDDSLLELNGTYTLFNSKSAGKIDATLGYLKKWNDDDDGASGVAVGVKGNYDLGNKFALDYKLAYAPSLELLHNDEEISGDYDADGLLYKVGVSYDINKQFAVDAGYQGLKINTTVAGVDRDSTTGGFYVGGSMKF